MATFIETLIPLLSSIALLLAAATAQRTSFAYEFNGVDPGGLTYQGDAGFPPSTPYLRLTKTDSSGNAVQVSTGRVLYTKPIPFWDVKEKACFQTNLKFIITPNTDGQDPADGIVFFITAVNSTIGAGGGYLGVFDESAQNPTLFAVEFDIYVNSFDPSYRHVGIDIQSAVSSNVTAVDDAIVGKEVSASIKYSPATNLISVHGSAGGKSFEVSYVRDLSTFLPQQVQVGISAATGGLAAVHELISWSFCSTLKHI